MSAMKVRNMNMTINGSLLFKALDKNIGIVLSFQFKGNQERSIESI